MYRVSRILTKQPGKFTGGDRTISPDSAKVTGGMSVYKLQINSYMCH